MTDEPVRLLHDPAADPELRASLAAAREQHDDERIARLAARLGPLLGPPGGGGGGAGGSGGGGGDATGTPAAAGAGVGAALKTIGTVVVLAVLGTATYRAWPEAAHEDARSADFAETEPEAARHAETETENESETVTETVTVTETGTESESESETETETGTDSESESESGTGTGTGTETGTGTGTGTGTASRHHPPLPPAGEGRGEGQVALDPGTHSTPGAEMGAGTETPSVPPEPLLIRRAMAALASSPAAALADAELHQRTYPRGALADEREVIAIDALVRLGRRADAEARAARLRDERPRSPSLRRVERILAIPEAAPP